MFFSDSVARWLLRKSQKTNVDGAGVIGIIEIVNLRILRMRMLSALGGGGGGGGSCVEAEAGGNENVKGRLF